MAQLQVEDDRALALERTHRLGDVLHVRRLAQDVEPVLLDLADARADVATRRAGLR